MKRAAKRLPAPEHYIKTPAPAVPRVRAPHCGDPRSVSRNRQPVVNRGADLAPMDRGLAFPMMPGDQQNEPIAGILRELQGKVDRPPCAVETVAVKVDDAVGLDGA